MSFRLTDQSSWCTFCGSYFTIISIRGSIALTETAVTTCLTFYLCHSTAPSLMISQTNLPNLHPAQIPSSSSESLASLGNLHMLSQIYSIISVVILFKSFKLSLPHLFTGLSTFYSQCHDF